MAEPEINGGLTKLRAYAAIIKDVGLGTLVVLMLMGMVTGWLPSPMAREETLKRHDDDMAKIIAFRTARDLRMTEVLERIAVSAEQQNKINRILICMAWAKDEPARQLCLRGGA